MMKTKRDTPDWSNVLDKLCVIGYYSVYPKWRKKMTVLNEYKKLAEITTIGELFEVIDWDFDGDGLTVTDGEALANAIADRFPELVNDMPHSVQEIE